MITFKRPEQDVEIITDFTLLQKSIELANRINALKHSPDNEVLTEAEEGKKKREQSKLVTELRKVIAQMDETTIVLTLRGLNGSRWNLISMQNLVDDEDGKRLDVISALQDAVPEMLVKARYKTSGEEIALGKDDITDLLDQITDTQEVDLISAARSLNTPISSVPKAVTDLV